MKLRAHSRADSPDRQTAGRERIRAVGPSSREAPKRNRGRVSGSSGAGSSVAVKKSKGWFPWVSSRGCVRGAQHQAGAGGFRGVGRSHLLDGTLPSGVHTAHRPRCRPDWPSLLCGACVTWAFILVAERIRNMDLKAFLCYHKVNN